MGAMRLAAVPGCTMTQNWELKSVAKIWPLKNSAIASSHLRDVHSRPLDDVLGPEQADLGLVTRRRAHGQRPLASKVSRKSGRQGILAVRVERVVPVTRGPPGSLLNASRCLRKVYYFSLNWLI